MATLLGILGLLMQMRNNNNSNNSARPDYHGYPVGSWFNPDTTYRRSDSDWMFGSGYDYWS